MSAKPDSRPLFTSEGCSVHVDPEIHSGAPVFVGTRVPAETLCEYLAGGYSVDEFVDHFPSVRREQVTAYLAQGAPVLAPRSK